MSIERSVRRRGNRTTGFIRGQRSGGRVQTNVIVTRSRIGRRTRYVEMIVLIYNEYTKAAGMLLCDSFFDKNLILKGFLAHMSLRFKGGLSKNKLL